MNNGIFERVNDYAYARAADVMSTKSAIGFEWSVKLIGRSHFVVGIASQPLPKSNSQLLKTYQNAILYCSNEDRTIIFSKPRVLYPNQRQVNGDVVRFKFQPQRKKLIIELVRLYF